MTRFSTRTTKFFLSLAVCALMAGAGGYAARAADTAVDPKSPVTHEELDALFKDYIMKNPQLIMDSVDKFQRGNMEQQSAEGIKNNYDDLYKNDDAPFLGNPKGDVKIVEFFDYNCGYCKKVFPEIQALTDSDKGVKVIFKDYPILGPSSETSAKWALAAHKQGKYFAFHKLMMENHAPIDDALLEKIAKDAGLDVAQMKKDVDDPNTQLQIQKDLALGGQLGVNGTPGFVIGEKLYPGAMDVDAIRKVIADERAKAAAAGGEKKDDKKE